MSYDFKRAYQNFWMGFALSQAKLRLFRFAFFAVFALDAWLQISHAPRYGANGFNVSHFPWLDSLLPLPTRQMMLTVFVAQAYLGVRLALGSTSRLGYAALATLFAFGYYISQLNSLQHHYLLSMALCLMVVFPWPNLRRQGGRSNVPTPAQAKLERQGNWPIRMLLVALSIMYCFAAITKLDPLWLDGTTLKHEVSVGWMRSVCESLGWSTLAILTIVVEVALALMLHIRRLWPLAMLLGIGMHMSFEHSGLEIGLFSYFMLTLYLLLLPEAWVQRLSPIYESTKHRVSCWLSKLERPAYVALSLFVVMLVLTGVALPYLPFHTNALVAMVTVVALVDLALRRNALGAGLAHGVAVCALFFFLHSTNTMRDYYRYWGGQERRSGNIGMATVAYRTLTHYEPDYVPGHRRLGDLYQRSLQNEDALQAYEAGLILDPNHFALNKAAAQLYHKLGMGPEALRCAQRALQSKSQDVPSKRIANHWKRQLGSGE